MKKKRILPRSKKDNGKQNPVEPGQPYYDRRWRAARKAFLAENPLCVRHKRQGRIVGATVVDHIVPHRGDKELFWNRSNWQALCKTCHDEKTATEDNAFTARTDFKVVIIAGAPGSGKSTMVKKQRKSGDIIIDLDAIASALSGFPEHHPKPSNVLSLSLAVRNHLYKLVFSRDSSMRSAQTVWVITTQSSVTGRQAIAELVKADNIIVLDTPADICRERIAARPVCNRERLLERVAEWERNFHIGKNETAVKHGAGCSNSQ